MAPQPTRALVLIGVLSACAGTNPHGGFAVRPGEREAEDRCQAGSAPACGALGRMLTAGIESGRDFERGMVLLEIACGQDDLPSCTYLADTYVRTSRGKASLARAHDLAAHACERRSAEACTELGVVVRNERLADQSVAWVAYRKGCELGDARGCELFALATWDTEPRENRVAAENALAHACELGRLSSCHHLGMHRLRDPDARRDAAQLLMRSCERGYGESCGVVAFLTAPLISANADCTRVLPLASKACELRESIGCDVRDACRLAVPAEAERALERLQAACGKNDPLACLYWADGASARAQPAADPERIMRAYEKVCEVEGGPLPAIGCPRLAAAKLARAKTVSDAETELQQLRRLCDQSTAEACCELGEQHRIGKWVPADAGKARDLRAKACGLGCERCCR
jgi:TPR repeat protein